MFRAMWQATCLHKEVRYTPQEIILKFGFSNEALSWLLHIYADKKSKQINKLFKFFERIIGSF
jgi:hypothetical protein